MAEFPMAMAAIPMAIFVPALYTRDLGLSLAATGTILMAARITDVVTDPLIGLLSDRTESRFGRRKPWILLGTPMLLLSVYMLFVPTPPVSNTYFAFWVILLWLGWTFVGIPFYAWGAELSTDYHERTRIATWRTAAGVAGTLTTILLPLAAWQLTGYGDAIAESLHITALAAVIIMTLTTAALLIIVPEAPPLVRDRISLWQGLRIMWRNGPFKRLMVGFTIGGIGPALAAPLYVLFVNQVIQENLAGNVILLVFYAGNLIGVAAWGALARRVGKRTAWVTGMSMMIVSQPWYLTLGPGDLNAMMGILFVGGLGAGSFSALPAAMKADVIDIDRVRSGEDRTGLFFSAWSLATKLILAFAVGFAFWTLELFDFHATGTNGPVQLWALKIVFAGIPVLCYATAIAIVWNYPISEQRHARIIARLLRRAQRRAA
jgi:Na+/melibiose symporter-like transporter